MPEAILSPHLKSAIRNYAFLFFGSILFHLIGTWNLPLIDRDEPRFAEASREMIERRDYIVPYFNAHLRLDKNTITYWTQDASYKILGENDFSARFPSALAAALPRFDLRLGLANWRKQDGMWAAIIFTLRYKRSSTRKPRLLTCGSFCS